MTFDEFLKACDKELIGLGCPIGIDDMPDACWRDYYDDGIDYHVVFGLLFQHLCLPLFETFAISLQSRLNASRYLEMEDRILRQRKVRR